MVRAAFVLMMIYGAFAIVWVVGELLTDPGGAAGISISLSVVVAVVVLSMVAVRLPRLAPTLMGAAVALLLVFAVVDAMVTVIPRGAEAVAGSPGPVVAIAALVIAVPLAFLGLRSARAGGWLLVAAGIAPVVEIVARVVRGAGGGLHLGGSSGVVALPLILVGLLFLLGATSGRPRGRVGSGPVPDPTGLAAPGRPPTTRGESAGRRG
ncbi:hypothetical protein [Cellulomonas sp. WB94]|uniref:hypothetical protein n=1 Tax=Cellulomonas sp. WB94 TaxID=2173174 RepID=UPI0011B279A0|nr:hypothetical protein [Cellulomonas sp. WB94]